MQSTALILHPTANPIPGTYRRNTNNYPLVGKHGSEIYVTDWPLPSYFKDWGSPHWEIYLNHDGSIFVHACRPTDEECQEGDLLGALGSIIEIRRSRNFVRTSLRSALRIARILSTCDPDKAVLDHVDVLCVGDIETNIPISIRTRAGAYYIEPQNFYLRTA